MRTFCRVAAIVLLAIVASVAPARASAGGDSFTWIAVADHFEEPAPGLVDRMVAAKPALVVGIGDLVFRSEPKDFAVFRKVILDPLHGVGARFYPVAGNHDFPVRPHWFEFWEAPANALHYSFDYGNAHFVILDTNRAFLTEGGGGEDREFALDSEEYAIQTQAESFLPGSAQYEWLRRDLARTKQTHIFVFFHQPAFSFGGHEGSPAIQRALCPLFEQYRVTAVFMGHSHGYERFVPLRVDLSSGSPVAVPDARDGVVYIVTAGGGKPIYDITRHPIHAATAQAFHFVRVDVRGRTVHCEAIEAGTGKVLDSFDLESRREPGR
jgi:predicted phosphodiesterase